LRCAHAFSGSTLVLCPSGIRGFGLVQGRGLFL
jgi:hypothetical protein